MVLFNYSTKELTAKIVYYGPGLCGKTTNLQFIHQNLSETVKGKMLSLATKTDRTLFFDFLPMDLGEIRGMKTRIQLYTVPGQVFYNETRKLVLKGADGIVFVADSQKEMLDANVESFKNLEENLKTHGLKLAELPHVVQFNKRDLPNLATIEELNTGLNKYNAPFYETVATTGIGVQDSLKAITKLVLLNLTKKYDPSKKGAEIPDAAIASIGGDSSQPAAVQAPAAAMAGVAAAATSTASATTAGSAVASIGGEDINDLIDEVQESAEAPVAAVAIEEPTEPAAAEPTIEIGLGAAPADGEPVRLDEALTDHDLFDDPGLEIAHLISGETREIVIPVQLGQEGADMRRYTLSVRLKLDSVK